MAFPNDLDNVIIFKIHPAIGIARVSNNEDYYVFGSNPVSYKSNGLIKRQAVQFRIFAYGENHEGLGELTPQLMSSLNIASIWSAKVANRKIAKLEGVPLSGHDFVISAESSSDDANSGNLIGSLPAFIEGNQIPLGQITSTGLFIPPKGGVYRKSAGDIIEPYPAVSRDVADTTSDGSVSVRLTRDGQELDVLPAAIIVAPQDFSPDVSPMPVPESSLNHYFRQRLGITQSPNFGNIHNQTAFNIDVEALKPATSDFDPGFEVCLPPSSRTEVIDVRAIFFNSGVDSRVDPREVRIKYKTSNTDTGAVHGQLTSGLCSSWQGDFTACVGYWNEHLPRTAYLDEDTNNDVRVFRKQYSDTSLNASSLTTGDEFDQHVDKVGIVRLKNNKQVETERNPGDDIIV